MSSELAQGLLGKTDKISRRYLLEAIAFGGGLAIGYSWLSGDSPHIPTPGVYQERNPQFSPVTVNLGVVTVAADGLARYDGDDKIRRDIAASKLPELLTQPAVHTALMSHFSTTIPNPTVRAKLKRERRKHIIPTASWKR